MKRNVYVVKDFPSEEAEKRKYITFQTSFGLITLLENDVFITGKFKEGEYWDFDELMTLKTYINPNKNILEIGSHCGTDTLAYAHFLDRGSKVYAFEPQNELYQLLKRNITQNNFDGRIHCFNQAVFCVERELTMNQTDLDGGGGNILDRYSDGELCNFGGAALGKNGETVRSVTIDSLLGMMENVGFVHCDAQGSENFIFYGAREFLKRERPVILFENNAKFGKYLFDNVCKSYSEYPEAANFDLIKFCQTELNYKVVIDQFLGSVNTLLLPEEPPSQSIPKIIIQTSKDLPLDYVKERITECCLGWDYQHFTDDSIIEFFRENPIEEFPKIVEKFHSFTKGQHRADLFRYYFLYLKGGVFLDSDAIFETNIENILKNYCSVYVKSFLTTPTCLFNGFIATYPGNPIIYEALKHAYNTENNRLIAEYHYLCQELLQIYQKMQMPNTIVYQEVTKLNEGYGGSIIVNETGEKIMSHYFYTKRIPQTKDS